MRLLLAALAATLALVPLPAIAQQALCAPADKVLHELHDKYHEAPVWEGRSNGYPVVLTQSPHGETWSLIALDGDQVCMIAAGEKGHRVKAKEKGQPL